jgi:hypothetical protein
VVAPNPFHYLFVDEYARAYPAAVRHHAPGLRDRIPTLEPAAVLTDIAPDDWRAEIDQLLFESVPDGASEAVFLHRPSATLILTDLAVNLATLGSPWERFAWRMNGAGRALGPTRSAHLTLLRDARAAGNQLDRIMRWRFERIVVNHGEIVEADAPAAFARAFAAFLPRAAR